MTFTAKDKWLYENPEYVRAGKRLARAQVALTELMASNREAEAKQRKVVRDARRAKQDICVRLKQEHSALGEQS